MKQSNTVTILLIEDDEVIRELYGKIFDLRGYRVIDAVDGNDAIQKFTEHSEEIDLLITDVMMPHMNGKKTYETIKDMKNDIQVIFTSGYNSELTKRLKEEGFHYLQKPFAPQRILDKIEEIMAAR